MEHERYTAKPPGPAPAVDVMARRAYGTGTLRVVGRSWIGSWYGPDGRRVQRKVGDVRTEGRADGLTKAQAEQVFRRMRELDAPARRRARARDDGAGGREFCQRLELQGPAEVPPPDGRLGPAQPHRAVLRRQDARPRSGPRTSSATSRRSARRSRSRRSATTSTRCTRSSSSACARAGARSNPVKLADRPAIKKTETRIQFLDQAELEQLLAAPYPDDAFGRIEPTLYLTAAMTGLRQGELLGLRWRDVDFDARKVRVVSPFVRGEFGDPKSAGSGRSVPMAERVADRAPRAPRALRLLARPRPRVLPSRSPASRSTARSSSAASSRRSSAPRSTGSPSTSCATRSAPAWRPPARRCAPCSTGWATPTRRRRRSTRTTSRATRRPTRSIGRSPDSGAACSALGCLRNG